MNRTIIIAEAGVNHNGQIELAKQLVDVAAQAGADYVKFQTFKAETLVSKTAQMADYQKVNTKSVEDATQFQMLKRLELTKEWHGELMIYCKEKGIEFLSTPFDLKSMDYLKSIGINVLKIPSGEITNLPYLEHAAKSCFGKYILSTGMSNLSEIENALMVFEKSGIMKDKISVLHCNTEYPTPMEDVNLNAMNTIGRAFNIEVGYSDHTLGIEVPVASVALGAKIIEKHFTLDKNMEGPDHKASLEPNELLEMVNSIRNIEKALGDGVKRASSSEQKNIDIVRKSLVAKTDIKKGSTFSVENMTVKRPGNGISPMRWHEYLGKKAQKDYEQDELI